MSSLTATRPLLETAARRDRILIPVWMYALAGSAASTVFSFRHLYPGPEERAALAKGVATNPAIVALSGRVFATSLGGLTAWRMLALGSVGVAVMTTLLVVRHTRADEQVGRLELLRSAVVGRHAPLAAVLLITVAAAALVAAAAVIALVAFGLPFAGSVAFGLAWFGVGLCFGGVAAVTSQLAQTSRAASGAALAVVGAAYALRAVGDASSGGALGWLSWTSPLGWAQQARPFAGDRWGPLLLLFAVGVVLIAAAARLEKNRDLGAGFLRPRPGPATAGRLLTNVYGLAWRVQRATVAGWAFGFVTLGALVGGATPGVESLVGGKSARDLIGKLGGSKSLLDSFLATEFGLAGMLAAAFCVLTVLQLRTDEDTGRAEGLLAAPVSRARWASSHLVVALLGSALILALDGFAAAITLGVQTHRVAPELGRLIPAALAPLPAVWVVAGLAMLIYGAAPNAGSAAWALFGAFALLGELGPTLDLPSWALDLSPFTHTPKLPGSAVEALPIGLLTAIALGAVALGILCLRRRDVR